MAVSRVEAVEVVVLSVVVANSIEDILKVHDFATASAAVLRVRKYENAEQEAIKLKLKAERKAGEKIPEQILHGNPKVKSQLATSLAKLGISKTESSRWQKITSVPQAKFDEHL